MLQQRHLLRVGVLDLSQRLVGEVLGHHGGHQRPGGRDGHANLPADVEARASSDGQHYVILIHVVPFGLGYKGASLQPDGRGGLALIEGCLAGILADGVTGEDDEGAVLTFDQNQPDVATALPGVAADEFRQRVGLLLVHKEKGPPG